jgi:C_GCAxxG_C_C family probable redox protein
MAKNNKFKEAKAIFEQGYNCCQAVFVPFAMEKGIDEQTSFKISSGFAAGMCYHGETCGAVVGAHMAIGLNAGYDNQNDQEGKELVKNLIAEYRKRFNKKNGTTLCKELLGADPSSEKGLSFLRENGIFKEKCPGFVADSAEIVQSLLDK